MPAYRMLLALITGCSLPQFPVAQPSDAQVAVSPTQIVVLNTFEAQVYDRNTGTIQTGTSRMVPTVCSVGGGGCNPTGLWGLIVRANVTAGILDATGVIVDSRLRYDAIRNRWYRTGFCTDGIHPQQLCLAVSFGPDVTGGWYLGMIGAEIHDFMRLGFSQDWIVSVNDDSTLTFVDKARALAGDFRNPIIRNIGMPWAVPVQNLYGTALPTFLSVEPAPGNFPLWRVWTHDPVANATTASAPAPVLDPDFWSGPLVGNTPSGTIIPGQTLSEAWQSADGRWIVGTGVANLQLVQRAYLITLDAQRGYVPATDGSALRFANVPTIHSAVAINPNGGNIIVTAIETNTTVSPTHVVGLTTVTDTGAVNFVSVQDGAAALGNPSLTPTGNGSGPVPLYPMVGSDIRGPDYLDAVADPSTGVWFVGQWVSGGQWWEHITWWH